MVFLKFQWFLYCDSLSCNVTEWNLFLLSYDKGLSLSFMWSTWQRQCGIEFPRQLSEFPTPCVHLYLTEIMYDDVSSSEDALKTNSMYNYIFYYDIETLRWVATSPW